MLSRGSTDTFRLLGLSGKIHAIFGIYSDKDVQGVIDGIRSVIDFWHLVDSEDSRILEASKLFAFFSIAERSRIRTYDSIELSFAAVEKKSQKRI